MTAWLLNPPFSSSPPFSPRRRLARGTAGAVRARGRECVDTCSACAIVACPVLDARCPVLGVHLHNCLLWAALHAPTSAVVPETSMGISLSMVALCIELPGMWSAAIWHNLANAMPFACAQLPAEVLRISL